MPGPFTSASYRPSCISNPCSCASHSNAVPVRSQPLTAHHAVPLPPAHPQIRVSMPLSHDRYHIASAVQKLRKRGRPVRDLCTFTHLSSLSSSLPSQPPAQQTRSKDSSTSRTAQSRYAST